MLLRVPFNSDIMYMLCYFVGVGSIGKVEGSVGCGVAVGVGVGVGSPGDVEGTASVVLMVSILLTVLVMLVVVVCILVGFGSPDDVSGTASVVDGFNSVHGADNVAGGGGGLCSWCGWS